ncbi:MAG TPA: DUF885 domain-containing protein [Burkholderiaceae bacterium]
MKLTRLCTALAFTTLPVLAFGQAFDKWAEAVAIERMRADPVGATARQYLEPAEQQKLDGQLTPNTRAARAKSIALAKKQLAQMAKMNQKKMTQDERISYRVVEWTLKNRIASEPYLDYEFPFSQFRGIHVGLVNFLSQSHPIRNKTDIDNYLSRLGQVPAQMDEAIKQAREAESRGVLMPNFIYVSALGQFSRFLAEAPAKNVLVASLGERMAAVKDVSDADKAAYLAQAEKITADAVIPSFRRAEALLNEQMPKATADAGLWRFKDGAKVYAYELRRNTSTDLTPQQIHEIGQKEVARIEAEMDGLLRKLGYTEGTIGQRMTKLDLDTQPKGEGDPRPALIARFDSLLRDAEQRAKLIFDITPKAPVVVKREPPFTEKTAAAHYTGPSKDGTRPGIFWAPLPGPVFKISNMRTLTYHEGVPGHHFQIALMQENQGLPRFRRDGVFGGGSAYAEGWALYSEQVAAENNWYGDDIQGRLGQLDAELFRSKRLVTDTGLHAMKWTRQQAIDYGVPAHEVERYVVIPGQACAYKLGMLKILELRTRAQAKLGDKFQIKQFHNVVLKTGNVPLPVLDSVIDDWIASVK